MTLVPKFFGTLDFDISHLIINNECWFQATHIGENLEYANPGKACRDCVKEKYRKQRCELVDPESLSKYERNTVFINEAGLWCWLATSKQPNAEKFQDFIYEVALPRLRKEIITQGCHAQLPSENALHFRVVEFIRKFYSDCLLTCGLGEMLDSKSKRHEGWKKGYTGGTSDIQIHNSNVHYSGLQIELKNSMTGGVLSDNQRQLLRKYRLNNF